MQRSNQPDWASLPRELVQEIGRRMGPGHLSAAAATCTNWRSAAGQLVTELCVPHCAEGILLPVAPVGCTRLEAVRRYQSAALASAGPSSGSSAQGSSSLTLQGITQPLISRLRERFPFASTLDVYRSELHHPTLERAALQTLSSLQPPLTRLTLHDNLSWDFPAPLSVLSSITSLVSLKLWGLGAPGMDPAAQVCTAASVLPSTAALPSNPSVIRVLSVHAVSPLAHVSSTGPNRSMHSARASSLSARSRT
jgi:hypothetical protein